MHGVGLIEVDIGAARELYESAAAAGEAAGDYMLGEYELADGDAVSARVHFGTAANKGVRATDHMIRSLRQRIDYLRVLVVYV